MENIEKKPYKKGFNKGFLQVKLGDEETVKKEIEKALSAKNRNTFYVYKKGVVECKASQAVEIECIFRKYGITDVWGK
ncbi:MAG: hypothetical protein LBI60_05745 [Bacteroidales bacterium]|jgi:hypothetical protein|nr:hypothetical protein [Bacteroidales bacterium]